MAAMVIASVKVVDILTNQKKNKHEKDGKGGLRMKWKILYEVKFTGLWEMTVDAETRLSAIAKLKEMIPDKVEIVRVQKV